MIRLMSLVEFFSRLNTFIAMSQIAKAVHLKSEVQAQRKRHHTVVDLVVNLH